MDSLLGWKDFGEALFAQSRAIEDVKQYPAYGIALQAKLANVESGLQTIKAQAATNGVVVEPAPAVALTADYYGAIDPAGQLPFDLDFTIDLLGNDILSDPRTLVEYELNGVAGSETAPGTFEVTAVTKSAASVTLKVTFAGVLQGRWTTPITVTKAAAPIPPPPDPDVPPPPPPPTPPATTTQMVPLSSPASTDAFALVGSVDVEGGYTYRLSLAAELHPALTAIGEGSAEVYVAWKPAIGGWTQEGATVVGAPASIVALTEDYAYGGGFVQRNYRELVTQPGYIAISRDIVLPSGNYTIGLFAKLLYNLPVNFSDSALLEAL